MRCHVIQRKWWPTVTHLLFIKQALSLLLVNRILILPC